MKNTLLTLIIAIFITNISIAQDNATSNSELGQRMSLTESSLVIKGTSTLHDWDSKAKQSEAYIVLNNTAEQIEKLHLDVQVSSIENSKGSGMMDKLTHKALKAKKHPVITYEFIDAEIVNNASETLELKLTGDLTIGGETKRVDIITSVNKTGSHVTLKGSHKLLMTDYGVEPPTALFGTVETGDEVTIEFMVKF